MASSLLRDGAAVSTGATPHGSWWMGLSRAGRAAAGGTARLKAPHGGGTPGWSWAQDLSGLPACPQRGKRGTMTVCTAALGPVAGLARQPPFLAPLLQDPFETKQVTGTSEGAPVFRMLRHARGRHEHTRRPPTGAKGQSSAKGVSLGPPSRAPADAASMGRWLTGRGARPRESPPPGQDGAYQNTLF